MIPMTNAERAKFKDILRIAYQDKQLLSREFARASVAARQVHSDHQSSVLNAYTRILKELVDESGAPGSAPAGGGRFIV